MKRLLGRMMAGLAVVFALALASGGEGGLRAAAPNVLLIVADDLGWGDVPWRGSPARMPNLDALRQSGTELLRFYASPLCSPTRAALLTGRSAFQQGIRDQFAPNNDGVSLLEHFLPESFRAAGYATALVGKWHLGSTSAERLPQQRGFDHFYGFTGPAVDYYTHRFTGPGTPLDWQRNGVTLTEEGYATDLIAAEEVRLLRARDKARPFLHVVTFNAPHTPYAAPDALKANYPTLSGDAQTYAAMLESLDLGIGAILAELAAQNLANDTLVVFVSDNGAVGPGRNTPLRAAKGNVYDGGIRVPAIVRWPGVVRAGATSEQFVAAQDLLPTLASAAGVTLRNGLPLDGRDVWTPLRTGAGTVERTFTVATTNYAQFDGRWKLVRIGARDELYDIVADPAETTNRAAAEPAALASMQALLAAAVTRSLSAEPTGDARVTNLSARAQVGGVAGTPFLGFVVIGGDKRLVVRGVGPAITGFGVPGALADPLVELRQGQTLLQANDNWLAADAATMAAVGAFGLPVASKDAALVAMLPAGSYTAQISAAAAGANGVALVEVYDTGVGGAAARLVNASTRAFVGSGEAVLIPGFAVGGHGAAGLLIRVAGPALGKFGVGDALVDPVLTLYRGGSVIATNDDWGAAENATQLASAAAAAGAFAFEAGSRDAALLTTLPAGTGYTVQVSGKNGATGTALVEFYLVP